MLLLYSFLISVALKAVAWAWRFKETENDSLVHRTRGVTTPQYIQPFWRTRRSWSVRKKPDTKKISWDCPFDGAPQDLSTVLSLIAEYILLGEMMTSRPCLPASWTCSYLWALLIQVLKSKKIILPINVKHNHFVQHKTFWQYKLWNY